MPDALQGDFPFLQEFPQPSWLKLSFVSDVFMKGGYVFCSGRNVYVLSFKWDSKALAKCFDPLTKRSFLYKVEATCRDTFTN